MKIPYIYIITTGDVKASEDLDDDSDEEYLPECRNKLFTNVETSEILNQCKSIIRNGPISAVRITSALGRSSQGSNILEKYRMTQIQTRLKYERRKIRM